MITTKPTGAEVDAAINMLSILALAKDADAMKAVLEELRAVQDDTQEKIKQASDAMARASERIIEVQAMREEARQLKEMADAQLAQAHKATEDASNDRAYARRAREEFDAWAAEERQKLADREARCAVIEHDIASRELELSKGWEILDEERARVGGAQDAAIAMAAEYEAKLAELKKVVG